MTPRHLNRREINKLLKALRLGDVITVWWRDANNDSAWVNDHYVKQELKEDILGSPCDSTGRYIGKTKKHLHLAMDRNPFGSEWANRGTIPIALITDIFMWGHVNPETGDRLVKDDTLT